MQGVGVGPRAVAAVIDIFVLTLISCCLLLVLNIGFMDIDADSDPATAADDIPLWINLLGVVLGLVYFIAMEGLTGTTLGKRLLKLKVVKADGSPITMREAVIRNVVRIIDGLFFYLIAAVAVWTSDRNQRLGDRTAGTLVINDTGHGGGPAPEQPL